MSRVIAKILEVLLLTKRESFGLLLSWVAAALEIQKDFYSA